VERTRVDPSVRILVDGLMIHLGSIVFYVFIQRRFEGTK
jgi:hypothetical protein